MSEVLPQQALAVRKSLDEKQAEMRAKYDPPPAPKEPKVLPDHVRVNRLNRSFGERLRRILESRKAYDVDPKYGRTKLEQIIENMIRVAKGKSPQAVAAATLLINRGYGLPKPADETLDAVREGGIRLVIMGNDPEIAEVAGVVPKPLPEFIDAEVINE